MKLTLIELVDPENWDALDLDQRDPELAIPLLDKLQGLADCPCRICFFGSIPAAQQLAVLISEYCSGNTFQLWRFPAAWRDRSVVTRYIVSSERASSEVEVLRLPLSVEEKVTPRADANYIEHLVRDLFASLDQGDIPSAIERARMITETSSLLGDISEELRAHASSLLNLLKDELIVFFPSHDNNHSREIIEKIFSLTQIAHQLGSEGIFRFSLANGHSTRVSGLPHGEARANVVGALRAMQEEYKAELLSDELGDVAAKVLMMQVEFLRARSRYEIATGETTVAFAFLYRAFELFLVMVLSSEKIITVSNYSLIYDGSSRVSGTGALVKLARSSLNKFLTRQQRENLEAAVDMRNKSLLGHEMLCVPDLFYKDISESLNTAIIEFSKFRGLSKHRKALREAAFGPESLKHYIEYFRDKFLTSRKIEIPQISISPHKIF
ncbi:hypothetical protein [Burkholderia anthina]|uniref:hypothetical protein n=1 Tax=Burkholderia anthina TaxID=179879 RepID=UPI0015897F3E|nr:hypothetical protein [Burkholderia anthina]